MRFKRIRQNPFYWTFCALILVRFVSGAICSQVGCLSCNSSGGCLLCDGSQGYVLQNQKCVTSSLENCLYMPSNQSCGVCSSGFYLGRDSKCHSIPGKAMANCDVYKSFRFCQWCETGFYVLADGSCAPVKVAVPNCKYYANSTNCAICQSGFGLNQVDYSCSALNKAANCLFYNFPETCRTCIANYSFDPNLFVSRIYSDFPALKVKQMLIASNQADEIFNPAYCQRNSGIDFCIVYENSSICNQCAAGFFKLDNKTCAKNPVSFLTQRDEIVLNCFLFDKQNNCLLCLELFYLDSSANQCKAHTAAVENCFVMSQTTKDLCVVCKPGFFRSALANSAEGTLCSARTHKIAYCEEYSLNADMCANCQFGFVAHNQGLNCSKIIPNCSAYDLNSIKLSCSQCFEQYVLSSGACAFIGDHCSLIIDGVCAKCDVGFLMSAAGNCEVANQNALGKYCSVFSSFLPDSTTKCQSCPDNAIKVTQKAKCGASQTESGCFAFDKTGACVLCKSFYKMSNGSCVFSSTETCQFYEGSTNKCLKCTYGYYLAPDFTCLSANVDTSFLSGGNCLSKASAYECNYCDVGYFVNRKNEVSSVKQCKAIASANCLIYNEKSEVCQLCRNGYYQDPGTPNSDCVSACPTGFVGSPLTNSCVSSSALEAREASFSDCVQGHGVECFKCGTKVPVYDFNSDFSFQKIVSARIPGSSSFKETVFVGMKKCEDPSSTEESNFIDFRGTTIPFIFGQTSYYNIAGDGSYTLAGPLEILNCNASNRDLVFPKKFAPYRFLLSCLECSSGTLTITNFASTVAEVQVADYNTITPPSGSIATLPYIVCASTAAVDNCAVQEYDLYLQATICLLCSPTYKAVYTSGIISSCEPIQNCGASKLFSGCETCSQNYSLEFLSLTNSVNNQNCLSSNDPSCLVFSSKYNSCVLCSSNKIPVGGVCSITTDIGSGCTSSLGTSQCVSCATSGQLMAYNLGPTVVNRCDRLYTLSSTTKQLNCLIYALNNQGNYICKLCGFQYILFNGACVLRDSIPNCASFDTSGATLSCSACQPGYNLSSNTCTKGTNVAISLTGCDVLQKSTSCAKCKEGYLMVSDYDSFLSDNVNYCVRAILPPGCSAIEKNEFMVSKVVYCTACQLGSQPDLPVEASQGNYCVGQDTVPNCLVQSMGSCRECTQQFYLSGKVCVQRANLSVNCVVYSKTSDSCLLTLSSTPLTPFAPTFISSPNAALLNDMDQLILATIPPSRPDLGPGIYKCAVYKNANICLTCEPEFFLENNACLRVSKTISHCAVYQNSTACVQCDDGYLLESEICNAITAANCNEIESSKACKSCPAEFPVLGKNGSCSRPNGDLLCEAYVFDSNANNWRCQICADFFFPNAAGLCSPIAVQIVNCRKYSDAGTCSKCEQGFYWDLKAKSCVQVKGWDPNCDELASQNQCSFCAFGFYQVNGECVKCLTDASCAVCNPVLPAQCLICTDGFWMTDNNQCKKS